MRKFAGKMAEYAKRYWKPETAGSFTAVAGAYLCKTFTDNEIIISYGATLGENIGFYSTMLAEELPKDYRSAVADHGKYTTRDLWKTVKNMGEEFGAAEILDSMTLRPFLIGAGMRIAPNNQWLGVTAGKLVSDFIFYGIAAASREAIVLNHNTSKRER